MDIEGCTGTRGTLAAGRRIFWRGRRMVER